MSRFSSVILAVVLYGCAAPAQVAGPLIPLSEAPPSAFAVAPDALAAAPRELRLKLDPAEVLGQDFVDFPALRLIPEEGAPGPSGSLAPLAAILREFVAPGRWDPKALSVEDGVLVIRHAPEVLAALQSAVQALRANRGRMIHSQVRLAALRADGLSRLENVPSVLGGLVGTFDRGALTRALHDASGGGEAVRQAVPEVVPDAFVRAPRITTLHGQQSHVMFLNQTAYVSGYEAVEGRYDPVLSIATDGVVAQLRSIANGSRPDEFLLSFEVQIASPTAVANIPLGSGVIGMPAQGYARLSGRCTLRADQALLVVTRNPDLRKADRPLLAMVITLDWAD